MLWINVAAVLLATSGGLLAGYLCGLTVTLYGTERSLRVEARERMHRSDGYPAEGRDILHQMNASLSTRCSEEDLANVRRLIMKARYVKDAGRMSGGHVTCSANLGRDGLPRTSYAPSFRDVDDVAVYTGMDILHMGPFTPIVLRRGNAYVALDPYDRDNMPSSVRFTLTMRNAPVGSNHLGGSDTPVSGEALIKEGYGRAAGSLYATTCSSRYPPCITASLSIRQALVEQARALEAWTGAGCLLGAIVGMVCASFYRLRRGIEHQLRKAIRKGALNVVYQPLVDMATGKVTGAEALVRWTDEDSVPVPPDIFVKIAEERGFVDQITRLVVRRVLADFGGYLRSEAGFHVNVNVAASDLTDPLFHAMVEEALRDARVLPRSLGIEITEGASARHEEAIAAIAQLRRRGHRVYIDDFGTGYSSLAYLKDIAVDGIKIDRAFTRVIGTDSVTVGILPQILAMAEVLKLGVVAEGVETAEQHAYYQQTGAAVTGQGWLYGRPVGRDEFRQRWLPHAAVEVAEHGLTPKVEGQRRRFGFAGAGAAAPKTEALGGTPV